MTPTPLTDAELAELERLEKEAAWPAPWRAHTFEIECPCPNGEDCGDMHSCEEVEAPEAYPASPEAPADLGDGQCVVQIDVPGLESLAGPNAAFIAASRNALPRLLSEVRARRADADADKAAALRGLVEILTTGTTTYPPSDLMFECAQRVIMHRLARASERDEKGAGT